MVVRLGKQSRVRVQVTSAETKKPLVGAAVVAYAKKDYQDVDWRHIVARGETNREGLCVLTGLGRGQVVVAARRPGDAVFALRRVSIQAGKDSELTLRIPKQPVVSGTLTGLPKGSLARVVLVRTGKRLFPSEARWGPRPALSCEAANVPGSVPVEDSGKFRIEQCETGKHALFLLFPAPIRSGPPLRTMLRKISIAEDAELTIDARPFLPGKLAGRIEIDGAKALRRRVAVVAEREGESTHDSRERIRRSRWGLPGGDGAYELTLVPGRYGVELVDVATGLVFHRRSRVEIRAEKRTVHDIDAKAVEVRVALLPKSEPMIADQMTIAVAGMEKRGPLGQKESLLGGDPFKGPGIKLADGLRNHVIYAPPGTITLEVHAGATGLVGATTHYGHSSLGKKSIEVSVGDPVEVEVEVGEPPDLGKGR